MNRLAAIITGLILLFAMPLEAHALDYKKNYILRLPEWKLTGNNYETELISRRVNLSKISNKKFLVTPHRKDKDEKWIRSLDDVKLGGWIGMLGPNDIVKISGVMVIGYHFAIMELTGEFVNKNAIKGNAVIRIGMGHPAETPFVYHAQWALELEDTKKPLDISKEMVYHGPPVPPPREPKTYSLQERAKFPPNDARGIKAMASYEANVRERLYKTSSKDIKAYYDKLLSELTWNEIRYAPGILLLIDHLVALEPVDQKRIANMYVHDGSVDLFSEMTFAQIQEVPPLFLILKSLDSMNEDDIEGLKEVSPRFREMIDAYKEIPHEELATLTVAELVKRISENLSDEFRRQYFQQSQKLHDYVQSSKDDYFRELYPFKKETNTQ